VKNVHVNFLIKLTRIKFYSFNKMTEYRIKQLKRHIKRFNLVSYFIDSESEAKDEETVAVGRIKLYNSIVSFHMRNEVWK
jgi:hypothetical protein